MKRRSPAGMPGSSLGSAVSAQGYCVPGGGATSAGYQSSPDGTAGVPAWRAAALARIPASSSALARIQAAKDLLPQRLLGGQVAEQERNVRELEEEGCLLFGRFQGLFIKPLRLAQVAFAKGFVALAFQADRERSLRTLRGGGLGIRQEPAPARRHERRQRDRAVGGQDQVVHVIDHVRPVLPLVADEREHAHRR